MALADTAKRREIEFKRLLHATERMLTAGSLTGMNPKEREYGLELNRLNVVSTPSCCGCMAGVHTTCSRGVWGWHLLKDGPCDSQFVGTLREQLAQLYGLDGAHVTAKTLQAYGLKVNALERVLQAKRQEVRRVDDGVQTLGVAPLEGSYTSH
jgi:hypothetical protein